MANTSSAKKAIRVSARKTVVNLRRKRTVRDARKAVTDAVQSSDKKAAESALPKAYKEIDKATKVGLIHKNTAANYKSKLAAQVKSISK